MMARTFIEFHMNDKVRVRLTNRGRKVHRENYRKLMASYPPELSLNYQPPEEDAEGWSEWQMWELMQQFGEHTCMGLEPLFDMTIWIEERVE